MSTTRRTYCRLCEVGCGLVAELDADGRIDRLRPDHDHPITAGFACNKGLLAKEIHHDPDRVDRPQRRRTDGTRTEVEWDDALDDIAARLAAIIDEHGPSAVALYLGNPTAFNATAGPAAGLFLLQVGSDRLFSAGPQDCANKFAVGEMLWGSAQVHLIPDVDHTDHLLAFGTNPRISKSSFLSMPDPVGRLAAIEERGGVVRFVDPRHAEPNVGQTFQVKPDTDVYLLAAMLCEIDRTVGFDEAGAARLTELDSLRRFVGRFPPERVAEVVGLDADTIIGLARDFAAAPTASAHMSTGVNMGRQGALAYWLMQMLVLLTGNFDRRGGNVGTSRGTAPAPRSSDTGPEGFVDSPWGTYRTTAGGQPGALLGDMLRDPDQPIRALIVLAGNPVLSIGGGDDLATALADLDLLVTIDYYRNATGEMADYVLPAADWFEREDLNTFVQGTQPVPYVQWTAPVVAPAGERRTERDVFAALSDRLGHPPIFDPESDMLSMLYDGPLGEHGLAMEALRTSDAGVALLPPAPVGSFLDTMTPHGTLEGAPAMLEPARLRAAEQFEELAAEPPGQLKLITRRTSHTINSAMQNVARLKQTAGDNPLYLSPVDAERLSIAEGSEVRVSNRYGAVEAFARIDPTLRPGVVAMTHGFGNAGTTGMAVARRHPGVNVNVLSPVGPGTFDPVSTMSHLTGIPVDVALLASSTAR
ncbi:molybdopterin-containing oxidoreductase family protein [Rhabdothermincola salaria]|uniref:molybdopterin-containing oxidoreductase family protein n=1 Tax=Rhabdothermincola salaria TaxID=2903142 RepID=UPI001E345521|nr:molybdopterin-dependent oxidoreductase [Rhabdothermincola salaria]